MKHVFLQILQINDLKKKAKYTIWAGTLPIGVHKKGDCKFKKNCVTCKHLWALEVRNTSIKSVEIILKSKRLFKGENEAGRLILPLDWFPVNAVVTDWFPVTDHSDNKYMAEVKLHIAEGRVQPFHAHTGALLVVPSWDRPTGHELRRSNTLPTVQVTEISDIPMNNNNNNSSSNQMLTPQLMQPQQLQPMYYQQQSQAQSMYSIPPQQQQQQNAGLPPAFYQQSQQQFITPQYVPQQQQPNYLPQQYYPQQPQSPSISQQGSSQQQNLPVYTPVNAYGLADDGANPNVFPSVCPTVS